MIIKTKYGDLVATEEVVKRLQALLQYTDTTPENVGFATELYRSINESLRKKKYGKIYYHGYVIVIKDINPHDNTEHHYYEIYKCRELVYDFRDYVKTIVGSLEYVLNYIDTYLI